MMMRSDLVLFYCTWAGRAEFCSPGGAAGADGSSRTGFGLLLLWSVCSGRWPQPPAHLDHQREFWVLFSVHININGGKYTNSVVVAYRLSHIYVEQDGIRQADTPMKTQILCSSIKVLLLYKHLVWVVNTLLEQNESNVT